MNGPNENGHRANGARQIPRQAQQLHFANVDGCGKALATKQRRAALCGYTADELSDGANLAREWNYSTAVPCLRAVGDLLRQIGGR